MYCVISAWHLNVEKKVGGGLSAVNGGTIGYQCDAFNDASSVWLR